MSRRHNAFLTAKLIFATAVIAGRKCLAHNESLGLAFGNIVFLFLGVLAQVDSKHALAASLVTFAMILVICLPGGVLYIFYRPSIDRTCPNRRELRPRLFGFKRYRMALPLPFIALEEREGICW